MHPRTQEVLEYLEATRSELGTALENIPPARRDERPAPDRWSAAEVLDHLNIIQAQVTQLLSGRITAAKAAGLAQETETSSVLDTVDRGRITDRSQRVTAPEFVRPQAGCDAASVWTALQQSSANLRAAILEGDGFALGEVLHPHPALGSINLYQWLVFVGSHEARHTAQVREIAAAFASPRSAVVEG